AAADNRGGDVHALPVLGDSAPRDIDPLLLLQHLGNGVVGQDVAYRFCLDQLADAVAHRLGRVLIATIAGGDGGGEEVLHLEQAARRRHVLVGGHPADGG